MTISISADGVLEIAEQIERNGARFYRRASQGFSDPRARELLLDLAIMEDGHERVFAAMRADLSLQERDSTVPDPYAEAVLHLGGMADGPLLDVMADPSERLTGKETMEEILRTAIGLEKDSLVYYLGIKTMVPERLGRDKIDAVIEQEMGHIAMLTKELASLARQGAAAQ
jgi:rubrerythrin